MSSEWAQVLVAAITVVGVCYTAYQANGAKHAARGASHQAKSASKHAEQAVTLSTPTGNGFAARVDNNLREIMVIATEGRDAALRAEDKADKAVESMQRHLEAHANGQLASVRAVRR